MTSKKGFIKLIEKLLFRLLYIIIFFITIITIMNRMLTSKMIHDPDIDLKKNAFSRETNFIPGFPSDFIIGTATSAFQIEGEGNTEWKGFRGRDGTLLGKAIDHYGRYKEDMEYILYLGNSYRFSMDWSGLQKNPFSKLDEDVLKHYKYIFETLKKNNKKVCLVLNHFSNPGWFIRKGGWLSKDSVDMYIDYSKKVLDTFHENIDIVNTFNEPNGYAFLMHISPEFPGSRFSLIRWHKTLKNMAEAHNKIYDFIKEQYPQILVGISHAYMYMEPVSKKNIFQKMIIKFADRIQNEGVHERFTKNGKFDYVGFSYYGRLLIDKTAILANTEKGKKFLDENGLKHDDIFEIYPEGVYRNIKFFYEKYKKPILVTENGNSTNDDDLRIESIYGHLFFIMKAINEGIPVIGYFHWSTFDNFELAYGPSRRFGLVSIDFKDPQLKRTIKESGKYFHHIAENLTLFKY